MHRTLLALLLVPVLAFGADIEKTLVIKDQRFSPAEIRVPAGKKIKLKIDNQDAEPEEFHSESLKQEKVVLGKQEAEIVIGPLKPGKYPFEGELHPKTARGVIIAE